MPRHLHRNAITQSTSFLNRIFRTSHSLKCWKLCMIIPLLKPTKHPIPSLSYHPSFHFSVLCEILERVFNRRISLSLESNTLINRSSAPMALAELDPVIYNITPTQSKLSYTNLIFLDMEDAFAWVWKEHTSFIPHSINTVCDVFSLSLSYSKTSSKIRYLR